MDPLDVCTRDRGIDANTDATDAPCRGAGRQRMAQPSEYGSPSGVGG